jgi:predicted RNase H-like nuclease (RuvC/YqgF family)
LTTGSGNKDINSNGKKRPPLWLNWKAWLVLLLSVAMIMAGTSMAYGFAVIQKIITDPATAALVVVAGTAVGLGVKFVTPIYEALKDRVERAEKKAQVAERKADVVSKLTDANTQHGADLDEQMRLFKLNQDNQQHYIDDLQEQRQSDKAEIADLKLQLRDALKEINNLLKEIADLKLQLREVNRESISDKQEITLLRSKLSNLELKVATLMAEKSYLLEKNQALENELSRRGALPSQVQVQMMPSLPPLPPFTTETDQPKEKEHHD